MKTLQNNFTTPEQSKRLLELGVPADSSDCYYAPFTRGVQVRHEPYELRNTFFDEYPFTPCWSVGRLIEIYNICVDFDLDDGAAIVIFIQEQSPIVQMMEMFEDKVGIMDFSKLQVLRNPWISVEDRLPEEDKDVFVRKACTNGIFHLVGKVLNGGKWYCYGFGWQDNGVITHWMPIPELKKGE